MWQLVTMANKKKKFSVDNADRYRLRMVFGEWFIFLFKGTERLGALGPWPHREAQAEAHKIEAGGLQDWDKLA